MVLVDFRPVTRVGRRTRNVHGEGSGRERGMRACRQEGNDEDEDED
jgi:hypothetical protein